MRYSLITTVFNEETSIREFIKSINNQTMFPDEFIIVDGGSTDRTLEIIKETIDSSNYKLNIIVDKTCSKKYTNGPIAKGRNVAISNTNYENILVTDAGCILDENWVYQMRESFKEGADVVSGWYKANITNEFQNSIKHVFCPPLEKINPSNFLPSSRSLGFKKELWRKVKGYPENSFTAEDTLFDLKIFKHAKNIIFNPQAFVYWNIPENKEELKTKLYNYGYGEGVQKLFFYKYLLRFVLLLFFPVLLLLIIFRLKTKYVFSFYYYQLKGYIKGYINN